MASIIEDTNQKIGKHEIKNTYWKEHGHVVIRNKMPFGDYALVPDVVVDTKNSIDEIAMDIGSDHQRFKRSCQLAQKCGSRFIILIENDKGYTCIDDVAEWINPRYTIWQFSKQKKSKRPPIDGARLSVAMHTMSDRYGVEFMFCTPEEAGERVLELLGGDGGD